MPYAFYYDVPGTEELYWRIKADRDEPPKGQVLHLVVKQDGGLRHFNVWESRQERHRQERIGPGRRQGPGRRRHHRAPSRAGGAQVDRRRHLDQRLSQVFDARRSCRCGHDRPSVARTRDRIG